jgi:hypothetical protein
MRAITVSPGVANSARLDDVPEPPLSDGAVLVRTVALGVCATDRDPRGMWLCPPGCSLSSRPRVAGDGGGGAGRCGWRRATCRRDRAGLIGSRACAAGEWTCRTRYTERGIKGGITAPSASVEPEFAVKVAPI